MEKMKTITPKKWNGKCPECKGELIECVIPHWESPKGHYYKFMECENCGKYIEADFSLELKSINIRD